VIAEESMIKKALIITIQKRKGTWTWNADQMSNVKNTLDQGNLRLAGKRFQYYSKVVSIKMSDPVVEYVYNEGYTTPHYGLRTRIMRVRGSGETLIKFDYYENISDSGFDDYNSWRNRDDLYDEQWNYLDVFKKNCNCGASAPLFLFQKEVSGPFSASYQSSANSHCIKLYAGSTPAD
jgi:hypothetical protein